jgi:uncharacterized membrane protein YkoI
LAVFVAVSVVGGSAPLADDDAHAKTPPDTASLDDALAAVQRTHPGRVLKVELERDDDGPPGWVYEVKVLTGAGYVIEVKLDARTLELLGVEGGRSRRSNDD